MPPALWVQGRPDIVHDYHDDDSNFPGNEPERFVSNYRKAGGDIEIVYVDNEKRSTSASFRRGRTGWSCAPLTRWPRRSARWPFAVPP